MLSGLICHHHTATGALHWLAKYGKYDLIKAIGVDYGPHYAAGSYFHQPTLDLLNEKCYKKTGIKNYQITEAKKVFMRVTGMVEDVYDCKIMLWSPSMIYQDSSESKD